MNFLTSETCQTVLLARYDDRRLLLKRKQSDNSGQHLVAGLKGLGFGMLGGLTSVITEPIQVPLLLAFKSLCNLDNWPLGSCQFWRAWVPNWTWLGCCWGGDQTCYR